MRALMRLVSVLTPLVVLVPSLSRPAQRVREAPPAKQVSELHYNRGLSAIQKRDLPAAIREFRLALKYAPKVPATHNSLGWVYLETGQVGAAVVEFRKAIDLEPRFAEAS